MSLLAKRGLCAALMCLALGAALYVSPATAVAQDEEKEAPEVFEKMSASRIERIMKDFGLEFKELDNGTYVFEVDGLKMVIFNKEDTLQLYAGFSGQKVTLSKINEWNRTKRFAKAYLDKRDDPVIESDLELTGGTTTQNVKEWMKTFVVALKAYKKFLEE